MFPVRKFLQVIFVSVQVSAVDFQDCGSSYELTNVNIRGCISQDICYITLGATIPVVVMFKADFGRHWLSQNVEININFINRRPDVTPRSVLLSSEPCNSGVCKTTSSSSSRFTIDMVVPTNMALNQRGWLNWRTLNEIGEEVICFRVIVQTQSKRQAELREQNSTLPPPIQLLPPAQPPRVVVINATVPRDHY